MNFTELVKGKTDKTPRAVATPEWPTVDGKLFVRCLSAAERADFYRIANEQKANVNPAFSALVVAYCACDGGGERGYADADWTWLKDEPGSVIERVSDEADRLNILSDYQRETVRKNSAPPPSSAVT